MSNPFVLKEVSLPNKDAGAKMADSNPQLIDVVSSFKKIREIGDYLAMNDGDKFFGNSNTGNVYDMDYGILELFLGWTSAAGSLPYSVFGSWVKNTEATANSVTGAKEDTGYIAGATLGSTKKQWDWSVAYDYRHVKADAVVGQFNDSDFLGGNTGGKGHRVSGALKVHKNTTLVATFFLVNKYDASHGSKAGQKYNRFQFDVKVKVK